MSEHKVVDLVDAGVPADQGLSSLGLLMQLAGNLLAAYAALITFVMLFAAGGSGETLWFLLVFGLSIARSMFQRSAGTQLLYGRAGFESVSRLAGVRRYVLFALAQSVMVAALLAAKLHVPTTMALGILGGLAAWPVTLGVLMQLPRFKRVANELPISEDKGFEGAAILMTVLGLCGLVGGGTVLLIMLQAGSELQKGAGVLLVLTVAMLVVRSIIHVQAGLSGLRETNVDRSVELANRYANFGVISAFCGGGALLLLIMTQSFEVAGMALISGMVWMLMSWPLIVRRFFSDRQFADLLAGDNAPIHRRAPDAGLTALGWLLLAYALFGASFMIPTVVGARGDLRELQGMMAMGFGAGARSMWWNIGTIVLQAWAGFELIRMSPQSRVIATVFGIVGAGVAIYTNLPLISELKHMRGMMGGDALSIGPLAMALIIPIATIVLVNRKIAPTARARFKSKPTEA
jgi:hypothetical protein